MKTFNYTEVAVLAQQISELTSQNKSIQSISNNIFNITMKILKGDITDNYSQLYYKFALPLIKAIYDSPVEIRGIKTKAYKIKDLLMPESLEIKKHNEEILYKAYKAYEKYNKL